MRKLKIGLLGCGTVGQGLVQLVEQNHSEIARRHKLDLQLTKILVRDVDKPRPSVPHQLLTSEPSRVIQNGCDVVVELIGGHDPARGFIREAISLRKNVVTANKLLLARAGRDLLELAEVHRVRVAFEASVCGAIPIVRVIRESLAGDRVRSIRGVLNGTTNYVLTRMEEGRDLQTAVHEAQQKGFAEADPTRDLIGIDTSEKISILASLAWGECAVEWETCEGIENVTPRDLQEARSWGCTIRLVASAKKQDKCVIFKVSPELVPLDDPLARVREELNGVVLDCEAAGPLTFYGRGAGSLPSAASVLADVLDVGKA